MGKRIIREVSYRVWDEERQDDRIYSASLAMGNESKSEMVEIFANEQSLDISIEDVPLFIKVLQEFCRYD